MTHATRVPAVLAVLALAATGAASLPGSARAVGVEQAPARAASCQGRPATIVGTAAGETIQGTAKNDVIVGLGGNDTIRGGGGDDVLCGQGGADRLYGGFGDDRLYGATNDLVATDDGRASIGDLLQGGPGDDLLDVGADARSAPGGHFRDTVDYSNLTTSIDVKLNTKLAGKGNGVISGRGSGNDVVVIRRFFDISGSRRDDTFVGSAGNDRFDGNGGDDTMSGLAGDDLLGPDLPAGKGLRADDDVVDGGPGRDTIVSFVGRDTLQGGPGDDQIVSTSGQPSTVVGGDGRDRLTARVSRFSGYRLDGGRGRDRATVLSPPAFADSVANLLVVDEFLGSVDAFFGSHSEGRMTSVEDLTVTGNLPLDFYGTGANESVRGDGLHRVRAWMRGGRDVVRGSKFDDYLDGGPGLDEAFGFDGADSCPGVERRHGCP